MNIKFSRNVLGLALAALCPLLLNACSTGQIVARSSLAIIDSGVTVMNRETDLELAKAAIPANLKLVESLIQELPTDRELRIHAAQGFYGYAFGFVEDESPERASALYRRGLAHALVALQIAGVREDVLAMPLGTLQKALADLDRDAVPALFWAASNWAKWIDLNRTDPARIAELGKVEALMRRVLALDETYYFGAPHIFFGVWYGGRPPMLGGDFALSEMHFAKARDITHGKLLAVDLFYAQYLAVQESNRRAFHDKLTAVVSAPLDLYPEMALANTIAQHKATMLLKKEDELF